MACPVDLGTCTHSTVKGKQSQVQGSRLELTHRLRWAFWRSAHHNFTSVKKPTNKWKNFSMHDCTTVCSNILLNSFIWIHYISLRNKLLLTYVMIENWTHLRQHPVRIRPWFVVKCWWLWTAIKRRTINTSVYNGCRIVYKATRKSSSYHYFYVCVLIQCTALWKFGSSIFYNQQNYKLRSNTFTSLGRLSK